MSDKTPGWMREGQVKRETLAGSLQTSSDKKQLFNEFSQKSSRFERPSKIEFSDQVQIQEHLIDLWIVLRKIAKKVAILTTIILIIPGIKENKIALSPYKPAVLLILNSIIKHSLTSLESGGDVEDNIQVFIGSPIAPFSLYLNLAFFIAIVVALPVTAKELTEFIKPGLTPAEYKILKQLAKYSALLFILGSMISYYVILPATLKILALSGGVIGEKSLVQMYSLSSVMNLLLWGTLGGGILYASPIILVVLVNLEIISPEQLVERRREIIMVIFILAAFLTPDPTMVSMLILSLPLILIIEIMISWSFKIELNKILMESAGESTW